MSKDILSHCLKSYKCVQNDNINNARLHETRKKKNEKHQMQYNYSSLPVETQLVNPSSKARIT